MGNRRPGRLGGRAAPGHSLPAQFALKPPAGDSAGRDRRVRVDHGVSPGEYSDVVLFLATAGIVVPLFKRLKISPILGFLGAGVALGPFGLGALARQQPWLRPLAVANPKDIAELAEFGVVFLLFMVGLELSWERLRLLRRSVFGLGAAQTVLSLGAIAAL